MLLAFAGAFGIGAVVGTPLDDEPPVDHSEMTDMEDMDMSGMADRSQEESR